MENFEGLRYLSEMIFFTCTTKFDPNAAILDVTIRKYKWYFSLRDVKDEKCYLDFKMTSDHALQMIVLWEVNTVVFY